MTDTDLSQAAAQAREARERASDLQEWHQPGEPAYLLAVEVHALADHIDHLLVLVGKQQKLLDRVIETGVERWHKVENDEPSPSSWLGLTSEEYSAWIERGPFSFPPGAQTNQGADQPVTNGETEGLVAAAVGLPYTEVRTTACHAGMDGECFWPECPQLADGEPKKSGRHCPLDSAIQGERPMSAADELRAFQQKEPDQR